MIVVSILYSSSIEEAKAYCQRFDRGYIYKGLGTFKSLYIKSLIEENQRLKIESLQGLIECSKKLGLDYKIYERELESYINPQKSETKKETKRGFSKNILKRVQLKKGYIQFEFTSPLQRKDIRFFKLSKKSYKHVFDVAARLGRIQTLYKLRTIQKMRIAQFKRNIVRIVLENSSPFSTSFIVRDKRLLIYFSKKVFKERKSFKESKIFLPIRHTKSIYSKSKKIIVIDPGHGGKDSGAVGYKRKKEKDIVLAIAKRVYKKLKKAGFKVYLTRRGDYFVTLKNRTRFANRVKANLFISIHANAAPKKSKYFSMKGLETFFLSPARSQRAKRIAALENRVDMKNLSYYSKNVVLEFINREKTILSNKLAIDVHKNILYNLRKRYRIEDGGVRPGPFWVLVGAQMPAILIEVGYITNPIEAKRLSSPYYQNLIAEGVLGGVESYFQHNQ